MTCSPVCVGVRVLSHAYWMRLRAQGKSEVVSYSERKKKQTANTQNKNPISGTEIVWNNNIVDSGFGEK